MKITPEEYEETKHAMLVSLLIQTSGRKDYADALAASNTWKQFTMPDGTLWHIVCYRFDFGCDPEKFRLQMEQGKVFALDCPDRSGDPLITTWPFASYTNDAGDFVCFYLLDEVIL